MTTLAYLALVAALALATAYTRNYQATVSALAERVEPWARGEVTPPWQSARTLAVALAWLLTIALGILFLQWWKVALLAGGGLLLLVPLFGSLTPRPLSAHYLDRLHADVEHRLARRRGDAAALQSVKRAIAAARMPPGG